MASGQFSSVAAAQIDELKASDDAALFEAVIEACAFVLDTPDRARAHSSAMNTREGVRFRLPVVGHPPDKVFWSSAGPRIEAVFPYP